ncbi:MAG TPA: hypothetical protein VGT40_16125 [Methylomirabilota bacterium]|jgi:hypothetical protein|nr:hypothetical protein [Methylomirabilota bacterium]
MTSVAQTMKKLAPAALLLASLIVIVQACHTPSAELVFTNSTTTCSAGGCTILVTGIHDSPGPSQPGNIGPDKYGPLSIPLNTTSPLRPISSGPWHLTIQGSCIGTATLAETFAAGTTWKFTIHC